MWHLNFTDCFGGNGFALDPNDSLQTLSRSSHLLSLGTLNWDSYRTWKRCISPTHPAKKNLGSFSFTTASLAIAETWTTDLLWSFVKNSTTELPWYSEDSFSTKEFASKLVSFSPASPLLCAFYHRRFCWHHPPYCLHHCAMEFPGLSTGFIKRFCYNCCTCFFISVFCNSCRGEVWRMYWVPSSTIRFSPPAQFTQQVYLMLWTWC